MFQPGAYFTGRFDPVQVKDGQTFVYKMPQVDCLEIEPCVYHIRSNMPKYMTLSPDQTFLDIAPRNVSNNEQY